MMIVRILSSVVTSLGVKHRGLSVSLPDAEASALIRMGRAAPAEDAGVQVETREVKTVKRTRKVKDAD
jgi:hypothetical protein